MKPTFLGIGAQKCASSWVYRILRDHPEVTVSEPKELNFFTCGFDVGYGWYENHFCGGGIAAGEISPSYFCSVDACRRAYNYNPAFKIIVALRDPVERAYSNHLHEVREGHIGSADLSFEAAVDANPMYLEQSRYAAQITNWLRYFGASQLLCVFQEELSQDPMRECKRVYEFLNVNPDFVPESLLVKANQSKSARRPGLEMCIKQAGRGLRAAGLAPLVKRLNGLTVVKSIRRLNEQDLRSVVPPMAETTRNHIVSLLADDMRSLLAVLGRDNLPWPSWQLAREIMATASVSEGGSAATDSNGTNRG
ncbi:MAG: sulfotransferase [Gammaproteobacteria bacterium]